MEISFKSRYDTLSGAFKSDKKTKIENPSGSFTQNLVSKGKANLDELKKDEDKRYSAIGAFLGIGVLVGLGVALMNREKVFNFFNLKKRHAISRYSNTKHNTTHGGPEIDWTKGKRAIHDSWENYIKGIKERRSQRNVTARQYKELFQQNAEKLDNLERALDTGTFSRSKKYF